MVQSSWLPSVDDSLAEKGVEFARADLTSELGTIDGNLLPGPSQELARHVEDVALDVLLDRGLDIASNLPLLGVLCPARHGHLCSPGQHICRLASSFEG